MVSVYRMKRLKEERPVKQLALVSGTKEEGEESPQRKINRT